MIIRLLQKRRIYKCKQWVGVNAIEVKVRGKDKDQITITKDSPEANEYGWWTVNLPEDSLHDGRMHLNRKQAKELAKKLNYFARHGFLKEE